MGDGDGNEWINASYVKNEHVEFEDSMANEVQANQSISDFFG